MKQVLDALRFLPLLSPSLLQPPSFLITIKYIEIDSMGATWTNPPTFSLPKEKTNRKKQKGSRSNKDKTEGSSRRKRNRSKEESSIAHSAEKKARRNEPLDSPDHKKAMDNNLPALMDPHVVRYLRGGSVVVEKSVKDR